MSSLRLPHARRASFWLLQFLILLIIVLLLSIRSLS